MICLNLNELIMIIVAHAKISAAKHKQKYLNAIKIIALSIKAIDMIKNLKLESLYS